MKIVLDGKTIDEEKHKLSIEFDNTSEVWVQLGDIIVEVKKSELTKALIAMQ